MRVFIDADGCPVVDETVRLCREYRTECLILCDTAHLIQREGARTLTFSTGADSVDFALVGLVEQRDLVVTQDYGLAAMCLARRARVLNQDGMEYTGENIDALLLSRHTARKIRSGGGRLKGPPKRTAAQDRAFREKLRQVLTESL